MNYSSILKKAVSRITIDELTIIGDGMSRKAYEVNNKYIIKEVYDIFESAGGTDINADDFSELVEFGKIEKEVERVSDYYRDIPKTGRAYNYCQGIPIAVYSMLVEHAVSNILYKTGRSDLIARVLTIEVIDGTVYALCQNAKKLKKVNVKTEKFYQYLICSCMQFIYKERSFLIGDLHSGNMVNKRIVDYAYLASYKKVDKEKIARIETNSNCIPCNYLKK